MSELFVDDSYKNIRIKIDGTIVATQEIIDRVSITFGCTDGSAPAVGTTFSPHCDVEINSNEIYGDPNLDAIKMGVIFVVECEFEYGTYTPLGRFEIGQPVQYTDDYSISFSGEGMLGSVLSRKKMNWANMEQYTDKGVLTVAEALELVHIQFPTITIQTPSSEHLPSDFSEARIVVPTSLKKWKKNVIYKKRFVKITVRDFLAGIAVMMGGNVVEYGNSIRIVTMSEARENEGAMIGNYFSSDSFASDFTYERKVYVPKEMCLKTYETTPVQTKKKSGSAKTHGYCYTTECECASVYKYEGAPSVHKYTINVDCQWIGRSFEAFYFSGSVSGDSGEYEDAEPIRTYPLIDFNYLPCSIDFSGWNDLFRPATFVNIHATRKNTATQEETPFDVLAFIMDMTFTWEGNINVAISSGYNGDSSDITITIGTTELSNAWNDGTNIPEFADVDEPSYSFAWTRLTNLPYSISDANMITSCNNEIYVLARAQKKLYKYNESGDSWSLLTSLPYGNNVDAVCVCTYLNEVHVFGTTSYPNIMDNFHYKWNGSSLVQSFALPSLGDGFPYARINGSFSYNNILHVLLDGYNVGGNPIYKWNGTTWTKVCDSSYDLKVYRGNYEYNNEYYLIYNTLGYYKLSGNELVSSPFPTAPTNVTISCSSLYNGNIIYGAIYRPSGTTGSARFYLDFMGELSEISSEGYNPSIPEILLENNGKIYAITEQSFYVSNSI